MCVTWLFYKATRFKTKEISYKKTRFKAYIADSAAKRMVGLMHKKGLGEKEAMLFVFGRAAKYPVWMLNMRFNIDILWLDDDRTVKEIVVDAEPCRSIFDCDAYTPKANARYILELNSGVSEKLGIKVGEKITL